MRILVITHEFPPVGGGGGRAAFDTCRGFVKHGHEVHLLTAHMKGLPQQESVDGYQVIRMPSLRRRPYKADLLAMVAFIAVGFWVGLSQIRNWRPDIIHVHFAVPGGPIAWSLSRLSGVPYVITAHLGDIPGGVPDKTSNWFRWIYPFTPTIWKEASQVVAVSEFSRQLALKHYPVDIKVIPNGVDLNVLNPGTIEVNKPPQITFAGRFVSQKNPEQLVCILAQLRDLDWKCKMLGDGPLWGKVKQEIAKLDLQDRFTLTGWVTPDNVTDSFRDCDILFMPSSAEGLPIVGVQALAMGLAIVGSRVGGFIDIVEQGKNGYLFSPDDLEAMQKVLRQLINSPEMLLAFRKQSRKFAGRFGITRVIEEYIKVFEMIAAS
jgi:glycosyltransferase involved in cell wall biosynthesis